MPLRKGLTYLFLPVMLTGCVASKSVSLEKTPMEIPRIEESVVANRRSVRVAIEVDAPLSKVWETISSEQGISNYSPYVRESLKENWGEVGGQETVRYYNGKTVNRFLVNWYENEGYDLNAELQGQVTRTEVRLKDLGSGRTQMSIVVYPPYLDKIPFPIDWCLFKMKIQPVVEKYCADTLKGVKYFVETGEKVQEDQFGGHPALSAPKE